MRENESLRGKTFFHIDVNSAFLSWEAAHRMQYGDDLDLRTIPSAVGGDAESRKGVVLAKSIPAKKFGVTTGEPIVDAIRKCPNLTVVPSNFELYKKCSRAMFKLIRSYCEHFTVYSIDECFLDVSDLNLLYPDPFELAMKLKEDIKKTLGFTVSVGVSDSPLLAKMASDLKKPDAISSIYTSEIAEKMWPLPIGDLFMAGRRTTAKLKKIGINTIGDLAHADREFIGKYIKGFGEMLWDFSNGVDKDFSVGRADSVKSIGNSTTTRHDIEKLAEAKELIFSLTEKVMTRLRAQKMITRTVCVAYKTSDFERFEQRATFFSPTDDTIKVYNKAMELFLNLWDGTPMRAMGVRLSNLTPANEKQLTFLDVDRDDKRNKTNKIDFCIDEIRKKNKLSRASLLGSEYEYLVDEGVEDDEDEDFLFF